MNLPDASRNSRLWQWLAQEDWYMSDATRDWLARTPPEQAADTLARIAENAQPEPHSFGPQLVGAAAAVLATSENVGAGGIAARRVGTRAALMLADLGDVRCVAPLVRVFETNGTWQGKYQELVESALARFLSDAAGRSELRPYENDVRKLVERAWNTGRGAQELSPTLTDLLLAALRCLRGFRGSPNLAVLRSIAAVPVSKPNRQRVKDEAQKLLNT